jgi:hypothetical protein
MSFHNIKRSLGNGTEPINVRKIGCEEKKNNVILKDFTLVP